MMKKIINFSIYFDALYYTANNNNYLKVKFKNINKIIFFLKYHTHLLYAQLIDLSFIDYFERKLRFELFYNLLSINYNARLIVTCGLEEDNIVSSITNIFPNAN